MKAKGPTAVYEVTLTEGDVDEFLALLENAAEEGVLQDPFEVKRREDE